MILILFSNKILKMINFDDVTAEKKSKTKTKWPYVPDHQYRILITGDFGLGKQMPWLI